MGVSSDSLEDFLFFSAHIAQVWPCQVAARSLHYGQAAIDLFPVPISPLLTVEGYGAYRWSALASKAVTVGLAGDLSSLMTWAEDAHVKALPFTFDEDKRIMLDLVPKADVLPTLADRLQ